MKPKSGVKMFGIESFDGHNIRTKSKTYWVHAIIFVLFIYCRYPGPKKVVVIWNCLLEILEPERLEWLTHLDLRVCWYIGIFFLFYLLTWLLMHWRYNHIMQLREIVLLCMYMFVIWIECLFTKCCIFISDIVVDGWRVIWNSRPQKVMLNAIRNFQNLTRHLT